MVVTLIVDEEAGDRLHAAFASALPGDVHRLATFSVLPGGLARSPRWRLCVGIEMGRRIRLQGWRDGLIFAISREEFGQACLGLGPHDALLFHDVPSARLVPAVRLAMIGMTIFPPDAFPAGRFAGPQLSGFERLGDDDRSVMAELTLGLSNRQIAARLGRTVEFVRQSVDRIFRTLGCKNRTEVAVLAYSRLSPFLELPDVLPPPARPAAWG